MIIFANFAVRSAIKAMAETLKKSKDEGFAASVDEKMVGLKEIERLVGCDKMRKAEEDFLK